MFTVCRRFAALSRVTGRVPVERWRRTFLSAAYSCDDAWQQSIARCAEVAKLNTEVFFLELDRAFNNKNRVPAIDIDMFAVAAVTDQHLDDLESLVHRFRRTPLTITALPSTSHALIRAFLRGSPERQQRLMHILDDRINYGVFVDYYSANMLMDHFLRAENYRDAAKVASQLMLQEEWQHAISLPLALLSCLGYVQWPQPEPWRVEPASPDDQDDSGETVYVRVAYLRNEWNDDHFDLCQPRHVVGKTLAWLAADLPEQQQLEEVDEAATTTATDSSSCDSLVAASCRILGWTLFEKWQTVTELAESLTDAGQPITEDTKSRVTSLLQAASAAADEGAAAAVARAAAAVASVSCAASSDSSSLWQLLRQLVEQRVARHEPSDRRQLQQLYSSWADERQRQLQLQLAAEDRSRRIEALNSKRWELRERERLLHFFDNERQIRADVQNTWHKPPKPIPYIVLKQVHRQSVRNDELPKVKKHSSW